MPLLLGSYLWAYVQCWLIFAALAFGSWAVLYILFDKAALPEGPVFATIVLLIGAIVLGT